jgi:anaerobic selenocysteine-containing dehydrogenase
LHRQPDGSFVRVSWDEALGDIAQRLVQIRNRHGGEAFATAGGGYLAQIRAAMKSRYSYNSLGQEKTGDLTWRALESEVMPGNAYPFILVAGERRTYNANQIYRNPAWRKVDPRGVMLCIRPMPHNWDLPMEAASYASRNTGISKPSSRSTTPCVASSPRSDGEVSMFGVVVTLFGHRAHR